MAIKVFILAKNEEPNIRKALERLKLLNVETVLLDSGSTDKTREIAREYAFVTIVDYKYTYHLNAYNEITTDMVGPDDLAFVIDADMEITQPLFEEAVKLAADPAVQVVRAPVLMCWEGTPLHHASMLHPKGFLFRGGEARFEASGHSERTKLGQVVVDTTHQLIHDDRKDYNSYLASQVRYSLSLVKRAGDGKLSWRDRLRVHTPVMIALTPLVSYFLRFGFLDGRAGLLYALDRVVAETIQYRQALAVRLHQESARTMTFATTPVREGQVP